jgi:HPr kinase/phosphorylase
MNLHASCVAVAGRGLLILGPSGSGKSALALRMMAIGARLVADDRVGLSREGGALVARCPAPLRGRIEARGLGLLGADPLEAATLALAADLTAPPATRWPEPREIVLLGLALPLVAAASDAHFPAALVHYLRHGWAR